MVLNKGPQNIRQICGAMHALGGIIEVKDWVVVWDERSSGHNEGFRVYNGPV